MLDSQSDGWFEIGSTERLWPELGPRNPRLWTQLNPQCVDLEPKHNVGFHYNEILLSRCRYSFVIIHEQMKCGTHHHFQSLVEFQLQVVNWSKIIT